MDVQTSPRTVSPFQNNWVPIFHHLLRAERRDALSPWLLGEEKKEIPAIPVSVLDCRLYTNNPELEDPI